MKQLLVVSVSAVVIAGMLSACAMRQREIYHSLQHPGAVNCAAAEGDIRVLQAEKAHVGARIAEGVTAIYPASLVMGILLGTEGTKIRVATGDYNKAIDHRIAQIKSTCGIP